MRTKGFSQEYCFRNLEENSAKKGFDGLVLEGEKFWLLESKSSQIGHNNSHRNTVYRAYKGLEKQLSGENEKSIIRGGMHIIIQKSLNHRIV